MPLRWPYPLNLPTSRAVGHRRWCRLANKLQPYCEQQKNHRNFHIWNSHCEHATQLFQSMPYNLYCSFLTTAAFLVHYYWHEKPPASLPSRHRIWLGVPLEELSALEWCDEWLGTDVINQSLVDDPTALPPGFNLPRHLWAKLNHFRTGQGQCAANLARWCKVPHP